MLASCTVACLVLSRMHSQLALCCLVLTEVLAPSAGSVWKRHSACAFINLQLAAPARHACGVTAAAAGSGCLHTFCKIY